jgi:hypothetical protein
VGERARSAENQKGGRREEEGGRRGVSGFLIDFCMSREDKEFLITVGNL